jgi:glutaredoxin
MYIYTYIYIYIFIFIYIYLHICINICRFQNSHLFHKSDQGSIHEFEKLADLEISFRKGYEECMDSKKTQRRLDKGSMKTVNISITQNSIAYRSFYIKKGKVNETVIRTVKNDTEFKSSEIHFQSLKQCFGAHFRSKSLGTCLVYD